jgi:hypothetical protein
MKVEFRNIGGEELVEFLTDFVAISLEVELHWLWN